MGYCPFLPDGYERPAEVNGWRFDPERYNGLAWFSPSREQSVVVHNITDTVRVVAYDERIASLGGREELERRDIPDDMDAADVVAWGVDVAREFMNSHEPDEDWAHPRVNESVFDPPVDHRLRFYRLGARYDEITYENVTQRPLRPPRQRRMNADYHPNLVIKVWRGSGNAEIMSAPWTRSHDHVREPVVEPPEECGLDIALTVAREYAREQSAVDAGSVESATSGQQTITRWSA